MEDAETIGTAPAHYFIRANGETVHGNPASPLYVPGEPPGNATPTFNYVDYCLRHGIARIGWPDVGDLRHVPAKVGALLTAYDFNDDERVGPRVRRYLREFLAIRKGSVVLLPDPRVRARLFLGDVVDGYDYRHEVPEHPYECAHRVRVAWDVDAAGVPVPYDAEDLGISIRGRFWPLAFHTLDAGSHADIIGSIRRARGR